MDALIKNHNENRKQATALMVNNLDSRVKMTWVESYLQNLLAVWLWPSYFTSLFPVKKKENSSIDLMS